jgi:septum formation protein
MSVCAAEPRTLVLASGSPRRSELLRAAGFRVEVIPSRVDETPLPGESARSQAERLALAKARAVAERVDTGRAVLGADTIVVVDGDPVGKPRDADHAVALLSRLVGRRHVVLTAVAVLAGSEVERFHVESGVRMRHAHADEIRAYVATGESLDKAGAYAVQGGGRRFIDRIEGSESNVIGLPMDETRAALARFGVLAHSASEGGRS